MAYPTNASDRFILYCSIFFKQPEGLHIGNYGCFIVAYYFNWYSSSCVPFVIEESQISTVRIQWSYFGSGCCSVIKSLRLWNAYPFISIMDWRGLFAKRNHYLVSEKWGAVSSWWRCIQLAEITSVCRVGVINDILKERDRENDQEWIHRDVSEKRKFDQFSSQEEL